MTKYLIVFLLALQLVKGQPATPDCINAFTVQSGFAVAITNTTGPGNVVDLTATSSHSVSNPLTNPNGVNSGCLLTGEPMPSWYIFKICNTGTFEIVVGSSLNQYQQGGYYDWSLWKYNSLTCSKIINNQLAPLRCNWNGTTNGGTGIRDTANLPAGGFAANYELPLSVNAGDSLVMCINNYSAINYFIDFISVGTSSISNCPIVTSIASKERPKEKAVFYNAQKNKIEILDKTITSVSIYDMQGKEVYKTKIDENTAIDCNDLLKGVYFLTYSSARETAATVRLLIY